VTAGENQMAGDGDPQHSRADWKHHAAGDEVVKPPGGGHGALGDIASTTHTQSNPASSGLTLASSTEGGTAVSPGALHARHATTSAAEAVPCS
jgi:hypothetical protein